MQRRSTQTRLDRYEDRTAAPVTVLALLFIALYAVPILWPHGSAAALTACRVGSTLLWVGFAADLVVRVALAERRGRYLLAHPLDVASVVLPALRPLRVLRIFTVGHALFSRGSRLSLLRAVQAVGAAAVVLALMSALAVLDAERGASGARILTFADALWWSATTITTVGYGDLYPVTATGRVVAIGLMFVGISLLGIITASIAAWFVATTSEAAEDAAEEQSDAVSAQLARLEREVVELKELVRERAVLGREP